MLDFEHAPAAAAFDYPFTQFTSSLVGFSCPQESFDQAFLATTAAIYHQELWRLLKQRTGGLLERSFQDLTTAIDDLLPELTANDLWHISFGRLCDVVARTPSDPVVGVAEIGLRMVACGHEMGWRAQFKDTERLTFDRYMLPPTQVINVQASGDQVVLSGDYGRLIFCRSPRDWLFMDGKSSADVSAIPMAKLGSQRILLLTREFEPSVDGEHDTSILDFAVAEEVTDRFAEAIALLDEHCGEYVEWICRVIRGIIPVQAPPGRLVSATHRGWYGIVSMSLDCSAVELAEMLVHESCHQYYHQARWFGPVDDGTDRQLYFSPVKGTERPIDKILLAYHAFANVRLMNHRFLKAGVDASCERNEHQLVDQLERLEEALLQSHGLTDVGRALCGPLFARTGRLQ